MNSARQSVLRCPVSAAPGSQLAPQPSRCAPVSLLYASFPQLSENTAILRPARAALAPRIDANLTRVNRNPIICHSYEKHRGWGMPLQPLRRLFSFTAPADPRKSPHTNARQPKSFHAFTSHFSVYRGVGVAPSSTFPVPSGRPRSVGPLEAIFLRADSSAHRCEPSPATSSRSLFTTHYPRLTRSKVRFTRHLPGATHV